MKKFFSVLLSILACLCFVACTPSNVERAEQKMKEAGYTVTTYFGKEAEILVLPIITSGTWDEAEGLVGGLSAQKDGEASLTAIFFKAKADAEDLYRYLGGDNIKLDGKWIYWGDEEATKDFTR